MKDTKLVNVKMVKGKRPHFDVYIGRAVYRNTKPPFPKSKWYNPFPYKRFGLELSLTLYEIYILGTPELYHSLEDLKGKILGCWCKPNKCHGDILIKLLREKS